MLSLLEYDANAPILHSESNTTYSLSTVYPNPVDSYGQIDFSLPKATHVKLKLYNTAGQEVTQILNKPCTSGHHSISYDFASVPRGVYYYRLETNEKMLSKKVLIQ
nr:T9SS type A sorting domain-containing protein [Reichenbachiella agariperforans]